MASQYPGPVSAVQVGSYFVGQYYHVLQQQPDLAHQFYTDLSTMLRVDGDSSESASAILQIHTLMMSLHFTSIEVTTINSLESWNGGVLVVVSGYVRTKEFNGRRHFVQTFFLAPQEKGYFILNDIFHFVKEEVRHQYPDSMFPENKLDSQLPTSSPLPESPVSNYALEVEAADYVNSLHIEGDDPDEEYTLQEQHQQQEFEEEVVVEETREDEPSVLLQNTVHIVQDPVPPMEEPVGDAHKMSYASILRAPKRQSISSTSKSSPPAPEWHNIPEPTIEQPNSALPVLPEPSAEVVDDGLQQDEGESKSVYVRNLPSTVSAADVEQEFINFGRIKSNGVFIRNVKDANVSYAFVEFEDFQSVQDAIKASPIQLAGRQVYIEERRANSSGASRGGRRGRGRGNYPSESVRGRSGGRSYGGRGSSSQDGSDSYRARGNGLRGPY